MDHVLQAYSHEKAYSSGVLTQKFNGYDGMISLAGAASNTLPDVTEGRAFSDIERKAIIIPEKFIPDSNANAQLKNKSDYICLLYTSPLLAGSIGILPSMILTRCTIS